jgi:hypothetical protein
MDPNRLRPRDGARDAEGREAAPTAIVVDSQSVKTTEAGGPRGFDAAKKSRVANGSRRRYLGLPIECQITPADNPGPRRARAPLARDASQEPFRDDVFRRFRLSRR